MWDSPSWIGAAMSAKVKRDSDERSRSLQARLEHERLAMDRSIAREKNRNAKEIAIAEIQGRADVAEKARSQEAEIEKYRREQERDLREKEIQTQKDIAQLEADTKVKVAVMQSAMNALPKVIPLAFGVKSIGKSSVNSDKGNSNSNTPNTTGGVVVTTKKEIAQEAAKKKADELFPDLEPTFTITPLEKSTSSVWSNIFNSKSKSPVQFGIGAALTNLVVSAVTSLPVLGL